MILSCNNLKKSYGTDVVLEDVSFIINEKDRAAIVGVNGAGKSTLFKIITSEISCDGGTLTIPKDIKIGYFSQELQIDSNKTIYNELLTVFENIISIETEMSDIEAKMSVSDEAELDILMKKYSSLSSELEKNNGYEYKSRIRGIIKGLGFTPAEADFPINHLSGGQKTRVALGKLLLSSPDILLLDEPTNHLDIESICWLEDFLRNYKKSVLIISHDRYFIDRTTSKIIEIENKKSTVYNGSYSFYAQQKAINRQIELNHYIAQQKEIKRQEDVIKKLRSFNREKSIRRAESSEKALNKMEVLDKPQNLPDKIKIALKPKIESGYDVLSIENLKKDFDDKNLFENISFEIKRGEKVALIGPNGIGKTTLIKIILDKIEATDGKIKTGANINIGYYDQEHQGITNDKTIFNEISDSFPKLTNYEIRNTLAAFVFTGDDVFKTISSLSGGEKGRVALAKIMLSNANFLILDEPTNHLDINSKEILEEALRNYEGTCLYISHDRYFINNTACKIIELSSDKATVYNGNYDYYIEKKSEIKNNTDIKTPDFETAQSHSAKIDWQKQKEEISLKRKKENQIKKLEKEIEKTEEKISQLDSLSAKEEIYTNAQKSKEIYEEKSYLEEKLLEIYSEWEKLTSE